MDIKTFSTWLQRQGHTVIQSESSYWYNAGPRVYQAFPYGWLIRPTQKELDDLMLRHGILALRYSTPMDATEGMVSYHVVLKNPYTLEMLRHQARNGVKRGLNNCTVSQISFERLAEEGWPLQLDTLERQGRVDSMSQDTWHKICLAAKDLPGFEAWGAVADGELAATLFTARINSVWYVPYAQSHHKFLNKYVNNALFFTASCDMLAREGVSGIFYSLHSLDAPESVNEFKFRMSFIAKPVRQRVAFHPLLRPLANPLSYRVVSALLKRNPESSTIAKTEGMLRFYLQGRLPAEQQVWPNCLEDLKDDLLTQHIIQPEYSVSSQ